MAKGVSKSRIATRTTAATSGKKMATGRKSGGQPNKGSATASASAARRGASRR